MKFTYLAPKEYNDLSSGLRTVTSDYHGPHDFKIFVNKKTRLIEGAEFDHDGHSEVHAGTDNSSDTHDQIYLHSHNKNHIVLMAMLTNCENHSAVNQVETVCEKYNMVYQRHEPPSPDHTYNELKCTVSNKGVVTYAWWQLVFSWDALIAQGKSHRAQIVERLARDILTQEQRNKGNYCLEIIDYVVLNQISKKHPWKVAWPLMDTVTLDNSIPIGMPDGVPNGPRQLETTTAFGSVEHESCYHMHDDDTDGEHVLESKCPMTAQEAAIVEGAIAYDEALAYNWCNARLSSDHPSHCHRVDEYQSVIDDLIRANPDIELTAELIKQAHANHKAVCTANGAHEHRKAVPTSATTSSV